jgi:hypothetical protein
VFSFSMNPVWNICCVIIISSLSLNCLVTYMQILRLTVSPISYEFYSAYNIFFFQLHNGLILDKEEEGKW